MLLAATHLAIGLPWRVLAANWDGPFGDTAAKATQIPRDGSFGGKLSAFRARVCHSGC